MGRPLSISEVKKKPRPMGSMKMAYQYSLREASCRRERITIAKNPVFISLYVCLEAVQTVSYLFCRACFSTPS